MGSMNNLFAPRYEGTTFMGNYRGFLACVDAIKVPIAGISNEGFPNDNEGLKGVITRTPETDIAVIAERLHGIFSSQISEDRKS